MSQDNLVKLMCTECKKDVYYSKKNKRKLREHRLELNKFCKPCQKHALYKESK